MAVRQMSVALMFAGQISVAPMLDGTNVFRTNACGKNVTNVGGIIDR
jgi:hypothetical protein